MATQQIIQLSVVSVAPLPPGSETVQYSRSLVQQALWKARGSYTYSLQMGVWVLALSRGFGRNAGWTDKKLVRKLCSAITPMVRHCRPQFGKHGEHRLLEPLYLKRLHAEMREEVKAEAGDIIKMQRWMQLEGEFEGPTHWYQEYEINVRFLVGEDLGQAREVTRRTTTVLNMFIPANRTAWVASQDLDPGVSDLYLRLANGALINISWWDTVPAPLPGSGEDIVLEVHSRSWPGRPAHVIPPTPTAQCIECEFYSIHSAIPATYWLPVLPGGWVIPAHYKELLGQQGFHKGVATVVVFGEPKRTMALKVTTLEQPVAVSSNPARPPLLIWRALCSHCFAANPPASYHSLSHFC